MPTFSKVSHLSFSVRDAEASARWWAALLELTEIDHVVGDGWRGILLMHRWSRTIIEFQQHDGNQGEAFDPRRTGFDHMGFKVDTRAERGAEYLVTPEHTATAREILGAGPLLAPRCGRRGLRVRP
jgi:catechol 2,3-dioxygenase-like lactoylglutathione lyase family enzyme